jgi:hypothetical protein
MEIRDRRWRGASDTECANARHWCDVRAHDPGSELECAGCDELQHRVWHNESTSTGPDLVDDCELHAADARRDHGVLLAGHGVQRKRIDNGAGVVVHDSTWASRDADRDYSR